MVNDKFLLYGANGYTGQLITRLVSDYQLEPVLAGRNEKKIRSLAEQFNLSYRVIDLDNKVQLQHSLEDIDIVLHAAGPFSDTAKPMIEACIHSKTHYLDITGEITVFEMAKKYDAEAKQAGIMIMPGVGMDVVPTDCVALFLKNQLPDATSLQLGFVTLGGGLSHGTATTMAGNLGDGGAVRVNGRIIRKPLGHKGKWVELDEKKYFLMTIPWGDISTAHHTTGIPDIETYTGVSKGIFRMLKFQFLFNWLLRTSLARNIIRKQINKREPGPSDESRATSKTLIWGKVYNENGEERTTGLKTPDGYTLTAHSSLIITKKVLNGNFKPGYQTPASAYGEDLVMEVPGTQKILKAK